MLDLRCGPLGTAFSANQYFGGDAEVRVVGAVAGALLARREHDRLARGGDSQGICSSRWLMTFSRARFLSLELAMCKQ
jgi:hypothetical protein